MLLMRLNLRFHCRGVFRRRRPFFTNLNQMTVQTKPMIMIRTKETFQLNATAIIPTIGPEIARRAACRCLSGR